MGEVACVISGCPNPPAEGRGQCDQHLARGRSYQAERRAERRSKGVCRVSGCERLPAAGSQNCEWHAQTARDYSAQRNNGLMLKLFGRLGDCCECCHEARRSFLTLDRRGRPATDRRGVNAFGLLLKLPLAELQRDYGLVCWNCMAGKRRHGGICPHKL